MSSLRRRGQGWVIFESIEQSKSALEENQGHLAFGKRMRISFSKNISDITRVSKGLEPRMKRTSPLEHLPFKKQKFEGETFFKTSTTVPKTSSATSYNPPNKTLFVENMSEETTVEDLTALFSSYAGFVEARIIPGRGVGFAEFVDEHKSQVALSQLQGFEMKKGIVIVISNAKR